MPDEALELWSVPSFETGEPEHRRGSEIGSDKQTVVPGTVLVCKINPRINRVWVVGPETNRRQIASTEWIPLFPVDGIEPRYLCYFLRQNAFRDHLASNVSGVGGSLMRVRPAVVERFPLLLPPTNEQRRIVAAIEEHLSRLDAAVAGLKRVRAQLPRYRAAVLGAAVEGRLVLAEAKLASVEGRPADTAGDWLGLLGLPSAVTERPAGPPGWQLVPLMSLVRESSYGTSEKCEYDGTGPPVLRIPNVADGRVDLSDLKRGNAAGTRRQGSELAPGDLLVVRTNGSRNLIGRAAAITTKFAEPHFFASYLIRLRLMGDHLLWSWLALWWESPQARALLESLAATSAGQYNISLGKLDQLSVPLPPRAEAVRILGEFDRLLSLASAGSEVSVATTRAERLRQSILRRAFEGKLVAQDPNDETACVLLERIRAARAAAPIEPRRPRRAGAR